MYTNHFDFIWRRGGLQLRRCTHIFTENELSIFSAQLWQLSKNQDGRGVDINGADTRIAVESTVLRALRYVK